MPAKRRGGGSYSVDYPPGCRELDLSLNTDELVRRIKMIAKQFQGMDQDEENKLRPLALWLGSDEFLKHKSKDVRLLIGCCLADIFRIYAPYAPFNEPEKIKDIFMFLTEQLEGIEDPDATSCKRHYYLLENLAWVKTFNVCLEYDNCQEVFTKLFNMLFEVVNDKQPPKVVTYMLDVMTPLLVESETIPQELLEVILTYCIEPNKSNNRAAYNLAKNLIRRAPNAVEPAISNFFTNILVMNNTESDLTRRVYELLYELNHIAPSTLLGVLPQMELKLKSPEESERKSATRILGRMLVEKDSDIVTQHEALWMAYLGRFNDASKDVRSTCVQASQNFLLHHKQLAKDIGEQLKHRIHDVEEDIRLEVVTVIVSAAKKDLASVNDELIFCVRDRTLDKKFKIRREALLGLAALYKKVVLTDKREEREEGQRLVWVPKRVFRHYYQESMDDKVLVERFFPMLLVPYSLEPGPRMKQLFSMYCSLDSHAVRSFNELFKIQMNVRQLLRDILDCLDKKNKEPDREEKIVLRILSLAKLSAEGGKAHDRGKGQEMLKKFVSMVRDDSKMYDSLNVLLALDCTCKQAQETLRQVCKKLGNPVPANHLYTTVKLVLERCSPVFFDRSSVQELVKLVHECLRGDSDVAVENKLSQEEATEKGVMLLKLVSQVFPGSFQTEGVFEDLVTFLQHDGGDVADTTLQILAKTGEGVQEDHPDIFSSLLPELLNGAKTGSQKVAKHSVLCISALYKNHSVIFFDLVEELSEEVRPESPDLRTALVSLGYIARLCPQDFAPQMKIIITKKVVREILMQDRGENFGVDEDDLPLSPKKNKKAKGKKKDEEPWCAESDISRETATKLVCLKTMLHWLQGLKCPDSNSAVSTLRLMSTLVSHKGDLLERGLVCAAERAHLRLRAACCMLKIARESCYASMISPDQFISLAYLVNDPVYQVRHLFSQKLHKSLLQLRLPLHYMAAFSLVASDPVKERRALINHFLKTNINKRRELLKRNNTLTANSKMSAILPDFVLPYAVHLLAHDPDLQSYDDVAGLREIQECLWFLLEALLTSENVNFLRRMLETIKMTRDAMDPDDDSVNRKLYSVCDLAYTLISTRMTHVKLTDDPTEIMLPVKLFSRPSAAIKHTQIYLPEEIRSSLQQKKGGSFHQTPAKVKPKVAEVLTSPQGKPTSMKSPNHTYSRVLQQQQHQQLPAVSSVSSASSPAGAAASKRSRSRGGASGKGRGRKPSPPTSEEEEEEEENEEEMSSEDEEPLSSLKKPAASKATKRAASNETKANGAKKPRLSSPAAAKPSPAATPNKRLYSNKLKESQLKSKRPAKTPSTPTKSPAKQSASKSPAKRAATPKTPSTPSKKAVSNPSSAKSKAASKASQANKGAGKAQEASVPKAKSKGGAAATAKSKLKQTKLSVVRTTRGSNSSQESAKGKKGTSVRANGHGSAEKQTPQTGRTLRKR